MAAPSKEFTNRGMTTLHSSQRLLILLALLALPLGALGAEQIPADQDHRGIVFFEPYQVFPEKRPGNGIYLRNRLLFTFPGHTIVYLLPLALEGRFVYSAINPGGRAILGVFLLPSDRSPRVTRIAQDFYYAVIVIEEIVIKKMFRLMPNNSIADLLPQSKTADGVTAGVPGVAFYHVSTVERTIQNGRSLNRFGLRLHLALFSEERLRTLDYPVYNTLPSLTLSWADETTLQYTLADGRVEAVSISQFQ